MTDPDMSTSASSMHVAITGATGLLGSSLASRLEQHGHRVRRLVRRRPDAARGDVVWDPGRGRLEPSALEGVDAVVHLSGESIDQRWTSAVKKRIWSSRIESTGLLARTMAQLGRPPRAFLSGSAVGIYGDRGDETLDESSPLGDDFLGRLARDWEQAAEPAREKAIRVAHLRSGVVLTTRGGALHRMLPPFKLGMGGPIGNGKQWVSWIALDDWVGAVEHVLATAALAGPVNLVAPEPVTNAALASALGHALHRPAVVPAPALALNLLFGKDMVKGMLLASQRARPTRLLETGFTFRFPTLADTLRHELQHHAAA
jgi:uncharacterized protein